MKAPPSEAGAATGGAPEQLDVAHAALLRDSQLQFQFTDFTPPTPPAWLGPFARALQAIAPFLQYVFWIGVAIIVAIILYALIAEFLRRLPGRAEKKAAPQPKPAYRPTAAHARVLLEEVDRLAAEGHYAEAVRVLLHKSVEDIERAFSLAIAPALTSREIARISSLSDQGRTVFSGIAAAVESSLFGGRPIEAPQFRACRDAYAAFAFDRGKR